MWRRTLFYGLTSFGCAAVGYGLLAWALPGHHVFGAPYRMLLYHEAHPLAYIGLCCVLFGPLAAMATEAFRRRAGWGRVGVLAVVALATLTLSAPLGGMLWYWHDMRVGYFPPHWVQRLLLAGGCDGLAVGWLVVLLSVPYNALGLAVGYGLLVAGVRRFPAGGSEEARP